MNKKIIDEININDVTAGKSTIINILNKCSNEYCFTMNYEQYEIQKDKLKLFIENNSELNINVDEMEHNKSKSILANEIYEIDLKRCVITDKRNNKNYYFLINTETQNNIYDKINIDHISSVNINDFINSNDKMLNVKSDCGTGKSHHILKPIIKYVYELRSILIVTSNNALNGKNYDDLKELHFMSHIEAKHNDDIVLHKHRLVICSIQSLWKLNTTNYDYIIIDEFESVMYNYSGNNFDVKTPCECYIHLLNKCKEAEKIVCLDADLKDETLKILTTSINYDTNKMKVYHNSQNAYKNYKYIISLDDKDTLFIDIENKLKQNKKIVVASNSVTFVDALFLKIMKDYSHKNICFIQRDGVFVWNGSKIIEHKDKQKDLYIQNLESNLKKDNIHAWLYSPTVSVGISINESLFDYCFGYCVNCSTTVLQFFQQLFRARNLNDEEVKIYLDPRCFSGDRIITHNQAKYHIKHKTKVFDEFHKKMNNVKYTYNADYMEIFTYAKMDEINSQRSFAFQLINLFENHNLNYVIERKTKKTITELGSYKENKDALEHDKKEKFNEIEILNFENFIEMKKRIDRKDNSITQTQKNQYYKTINIHNLADIHTIYDELDVNDDLSDIVNQLDYLIESQIYRFNDHILYELCNKNYKQFYECKKTFQQLMNTAGALQPPTPQNSTYGVLPVDCEEKLLTNGNRANDEIQKIIFFNIVKLINYKYEITTITNNDLYNLIEKNNKIFKNIYDTQIDKYNEDKDKKFYEWLSSYKNKEKQTLIDKTYIKKLYEYVKAIFNIYDIQVKYAHSTHSTRNTDKIIFQPQNHIINYGKPLCNKERPEFVENIEIYFDIVSNKAFYHTPTNYTPKLSDDKITEIYNNVQYILNETEISDELRDAFNMDITEIIKKRLYKIKVKVMDYFNILQNDIDEKELDKKTKKETDKYRVKRTKNKKKDRYTLDGIQVYKTIEVVIFEKNDDGTYRKIKIITRYRPYKIDITNKKLKTTSSPIELQKITDTINEPLDIDINDTDKHEKFTLPYITELHNVNNIPKISFKKDTTYLDFIDNMSDTIQMDTCFKERLKHIYNYDDFKRLKLNK